MVDVYSVVNIQRKSLKCVYIQLRNYTVNRLEYFPSDTRGKKYENFKYISDKFSGKLCFGKQLTADLGPKTITAEMGI